jgi:hypothetical protein
MLLRRAGNKGHGWRGEPHSFRTEQKKNLITYQKLVSHQSAVPCDGYVSVKSHKSHITMVKFISSTDEDYRNVVRQLRQTLVCPSESLTGRQSQDDALPSSTSTDEILLSGWETVELKRWLITLQGSFSAFRNAQPIKSNVATLFFFFTLNFPASLSGSSPYRPHVH